jgi:hypothetical protein
VPARPRALGVLRCVLTVRRPVRRVGSRRVAVRRVGGWRVAVRGRVGPGTGRRVPVAAVGVAVALPAVDQVGHEPLHAAVVVAAAAVHVVTAAHLSCFRCC